MQPMAWAEGCPDGLSGLVHGLRATHIILMVFGCWSRVWRGDGCWPSSLKSTERIMRIKKQSNTMPDWSSPRCTMATCPIDSLQDGHDKWITWNTHTLYACSRIQELTHELKYYRWGIGLSEVRWTGSDETSAEDGHKIWFSGEEKKHQHGVAFIVRKEITGSVISCMPILSRPISIHVSAKPHNMTIIQVYAPTTDHNDEEELLESTITEVPKKDILIVEGDWNAKEGPDAYKNWAGTVRRFGIGETNNRGLRLLEFARSHCLTLANTLCPHKLFQTATWHSNNGQVHNQIDFILPLQPFKSSINKVKMRTFPGANISSNHDLMMTTFKLKLKAKHCPKTSCIHFDMEKLKDPEVAKVFQDQVGGKFAALNLIDSDVEMLTGDIK